MAHHEHLNTLTQGQKVWSEWRRQNPHVLPDLSGIDFTQITIKDQTPIQQSGPLPPALDLSRTDLRRTTISKIRGHSILLSADFSESDLSGANLSNARLTLAIFQDANCYEAIIEKAELYFADLRGADLTGTQLWNTKLDYDDWSDEQTQYQGLDSVNIQNIDELSNTLRDLDLFYKNQHEDKPMRLYFRGETSSSGDFKKLRPSVMRRSTIDGKQNLRENESKLLNELVTHQPEQFVNVSSAFSQLVLAQHHGLPTRLLDITRNPLVGLFHAVNDDGLHDDGRLHVFAIKNDLIRTFDSDAVSVITNFTKLSRREQNTLLTKKSEDTEADDDLAPGYYIPNQPFRYGYKDILTRLVQFIRQEKPGFEGRIDPRDFFRVLVVEPEQSFERVRIQSGAFLISAFHERFERAEILKKSAGLPVYHHYIFTIPKESKNTIMNELRRFNVTQETLFPGLGTASRAIKERYS